MKIFSLPLRKRDHIFQSRSLGPKWSVYTFNPFAGTRRKASQILSKILWTALCSSCEQIASNHIWTDHIRLFQCSMATYPRGPRTQLKRTFDPHIKGKKHIDPLIKGDANCQCHKKMGAPMRARFLSSWHKHGLPWTIDTIYAIYRINCGKGLNHDPTQWFPIRKTGFFRSFPKK